MGLVVLALAGCGGGDDGEETTVALAEQNGSGQSGEVVLTAVDGSTTRVEISIGNPPGDPQPAHIHKGSCADLDPQPEYPLENVTGGGSTTEVQAALDELDGGGFAINVHKSESELETYVACGDIGSTPGGTQTDEDGNGRDY
jgi:hypothetical protein